MGYDVFISYDRKDRAFADKLVGSLEDGSIIRCWIDHRDLPPGSNWADEIVSTIQENPKLLMVVLLSADTLKSRQVEREIAVADDNNVHIIPVFIEYIELAGSYALYLTGKTWINAFEIGIDNTAEKVRVAVEKPDYRDEPTRVSTPKKPPYFTYRRILAVLIALLITIFIIFTWKHYLQSKRFVDNGDQTITDTSTGRMWTKDADLVGRKTWQEALDYVASMNKGTAFGYTDWRLPRIEELEGLGYKDSWLKSQSFINVQYSRYWSSTTSDSSTSDAWFFYMGAGAGSTYNKSNFNYVWPVRGGY
ncbi:MAG: DUF1566 domain-containing protein [Nitrospirae bacterium]|uniref:Lcl domain-containing protein n=1 Tax=Candidatus Magnetobacterium casense TaxID=1455061 RepID=UPI00069699A9|nr:DUF1566 domain-containing protein [Candidatus Magnetobacterium casensis]MBF0336967.1 DUF1566 domain-containing protein [Nitrospirota bacterium]